MTQTKHDAAQFRGCRGCIAQAAHGVQGSHCARQLLLRRSSRARWQPRPPQCSHRSAPLAATTLRRCCHLPSPPTKNLWTSYITYPNPLHKVLPAAT